MLKSFVYWPVCVVSVKNSGNYLHGGAIGMLVDLVGSAAIYTLGTRRHSGISMEINASYFDAAYVDVSTSPLCYIYVLSLFNCTVLSVRLNFRSHTLKQPRFVESLALKVNLIAYQ